MQKRCTIRDKVGFRLTSRYSKNIGLLSSLGFCALLFGIVFPIASQKLSAEATIDPVVYDLTLATSQSVNMTLNPAINGVLSVVKDTVAGSTTSPSGYKLYISTASSTNDIALDIHNTPNVSAGSNIIRATSGTYNNPTALTLTSAQNAVWGYAIAGLGNFDTSYSTDSPATSARFAAVPTLGNEQLVHTHAGVATNDATDIYYGVKADLGLASGNYKGSIRYLTVTDISSEAGGEAQIMIGGGAAELTEGYVATTAEITTSLKTDIDLSNSTIQATVGNQTCANPTIITQSPSLKISCTIPTGLTAGEYDVAVNVTKLGKSYAIANGVKVNKRKFNVTFAVAGNSAGYGTVSANAINDVVDGTAVTINSNTVTIGGTTITATPTAQSAEYNYSFSSWTNDCGNTVASNCTITANFTRGKRSYTITLGSNNTSYGTVSPASLSMEYGTTLPNSGSTSASITIGNSTVTVTPKSGYKLSNWTHSCGSTLTGACTITANFETAAITFDQAFANAGKSKATAKDGKEYYQMQDMSASICSAVTAASSAAAADTQIGTLVDNRGDKKTYTVAKLLDGNCWMTENLRLGGSSAITLTSSDSEVSSNFTLPAHVSSWTSTYTAAMIHVSDDKDTVTNQYYGYYYNYYAASAGTVTNSGTVNASASICPKGWTLPDNYTQTANKSYSNLLHKYGVIANITDNSAYASDGYAKLTSAPLSFALSGYHYTSGTTVGSRGSLGYYWSGTSLSTNYAYRLAFDSSNVYPQNSNNKRVGYAIRCVAQ